MNELLHKPFHGGLVGELTTNNGNNQRIDTTLGQLFI